MKYLVIVAGIIFLASCSNNPQNNQNQTAEEVVSHEAQTDVVTLNNGEKWNANFATVKGIANMKKLISENGQGSIEDYRTLGAELMKEFQGIFRNCDMTGEAHNQLHNYLHPMLGWLKTFKEGNLDECRSAMTDFEKHLDEFDNYFN